MTDADARRWRDTVDRIRDLLPGHVVRVLASTCGGVGDVIIDGAPADGHTRCAIRRALSDVAFAGWGPGLTLAGERALASVPGATSRALGGAWPAAGTPPRLVAIDGGGPLLLVGGEHSRANVAPLRAGCAR